MLPAHPGYISLASSRAGSAGHPGNYIFIIFELCRFIPAHKAGLSRHLQVTMYRMPCISEMIGDYGKNQSLSPFLRGA